MRLALAFALLTPGFAWAQISPSPYSPAGQNLGAANAASATGMARTLSSRASDVFNPLDYGALGIGAATAIGTTYGADLASLAAFTTPAGAKPFSWATNPAFGLTFSMPASATQGGAGVSLTFLKPLTGINGWAATVAAWQDPAHGNFLLAPGMLVSGTCIAAGTTVSAVGRLPGAADYGTVTLSRATSVACASGTPITFTIAPSQLQGLTVDWLGWQCAMAQAWLKGTGGHVDGPAGMYELNHSLVNPGGLIDTTANSPNIDLGGSGVAETRLDFTVDLGTDFAGIIEATRSGGNTGSSAYHDFRLTGMRAPSTVYGQPPNLMDGIAIGKGADLRNLGINGFRAGVSGVNDHWGLHGVLASNNGCGVRYAPYSANMGNQVFEDGALTGNTIASICVSTTNQIDSSLFKNVHTGFSPRGFWYEANTGNVTSTLGFLSNSTLIDVWTEAVGNCWICGAAKTGQVAGNTFIGGGGSSVGNTAYAIAATTAPALIYVDVFDYNSMIATNWSAFSTVTDAVVEAGTECQYNSWDGDLNFVFGATGSIGQLKCGKNYLNTFTGAFGSGAIRPVGNAVSAGQALADTGIFITPYQDGRPFAGLSATAGTPGMTIAVITSTPLLSGVLKADPAQPLTQGQPVFPTSSPNVGIAGGLDQGGAIGTVVVGSDAGAKTAYVSLDPGQKAGATGASVGMTAAGTTQATATVLTSSISEFTTVASGAGAVLNVTPVGSAETVCNDGANAENVYPPMGSAIQGLAANAAMTVAPATCKTFRRLTATLWSGASAAAVASGTPVTTIAASGATLALSFPASGAVVFDITLTANCTITIGGGASGQEQSAKLYIHNGSGGFSYTISPTPLWPDATPPAANTAAGQTAAITLMTHDASATIYGSY